MSTIEDIRERFAGDLFAVQSGAYIEEASHGYTRCSLIVTPKLRNAAGEVMGGAIFTLADFAFAVAANNDAALTVTQSANIVFLEKVRGNRLEAVARAVREGRRTVYFVVDVTDELNSHIAAVTIVGSRRE